MIGWRRGGQAAVHPGLRWHGANAAAPSPGSWAVLVLLPVAAVGAGLAVALGGSTAAVVIVALALLLASLALSVQTLFLLLLGLVFLVVGQLQYFARIDKAFWIPYLLGLLLYLRILLFSMGSGVRADPTPRMSGGARAAVWLFGLYLLAAAASAAINATPPLALFVSGKEYFFLAAVLAAFTIGAVGVAQVERVLYLLPWFLAIQVPAVVYQRFVVAARRSGDSPWDAVVGLFGGDPAGGGASGTMGMFSLIAIVFALEAWKAGRFSGWRTLATCLFALVAVALAEVKLVIALLPVVFLVVFGQSMLRRPFLGIGGLLVGLALAGSLLVFYQQQYASGRTLQGRSLLSYVESTLERNTDDRALVSASGEMSRIGALRFWARQQGWRDPAGTLIGHGVGASRITAVHVGEVVREHRMPVGRSSLAMHLWEVGLLGAAALAASLTVAAVSAWRLARRPMLAPHAWQLRAAAIGLLLVLVTLPYGPDFVQVAQLQVLAFTMMGLVVAASRVHAPPAASLR